MVTATESTTCVSDVRYAMPKRRHVVDVDNDGNIGIGMTPPASKLEMVGIMTADDLTV